MKLLSLCVLASLAAAASGCPSASVRPADTALALQAEGFHLNGGVVPAGWAGSGFWIDKDTIATNAHVAARSHSVVGTADDGTKYHFDTILALDPVADIAILKADRSGDKPGVAFIERPANPRSLRGREIQMVGNSGNIGLGFFDGRIVNVLGETDAEIILHNATVVGGSSGSAIFDKETQRVVGIHHASNPGLDARVASPSWLVEKHVAEARTRKGIELKALFQPANIGQLMETWGKRDFCIGTNEGSVVTFNITTTNDLVVQVSPSVADAGYQAGLVLNDQLIWSAGLSGPAALGFALPARGTAKFVVRNPGSEQVCGAVSVGAVAWEKGIQ